MPRVRLSALHRISFTQSRPVEIKGIELANISQAGMGLIRSASLWKCIPGEEVHGTLVLGEHGLSVRLRVVHLSPATVGCAFIEPSDELRARINQYFDLELSALNMFEIQPEILRALPQQSHLPRLSSSLASWLGLRAESVPGKPYWFYGKNNCELYFVMKEDQIERFYLSFFANYIEGGRNLPFQCGQVVESHGGLKRRGRGGEKHSMVRWEASVDAELAAAACKFVQNISALNEVQRNALVALLASAPFAGSKKRVVAASV